MDDHEKRIAELEKSLERKQRWLKRIQEDYAELYDESKTQAERIQELEKERDSLLGDVTKLKALVAELEAKLPREESRIIIP